MEFAFTEEQRLLQQTVQQFALEKLLPNCSRWDHGERFTKMRQSHTRKAAIGNLYEMYHACAPFDFATLRSARTDRETARPERNPQGKVEA